MEREENTKKSKGFMSVFELFEDGKMKSTFLLYAFCMSLLYIGIYFFAYMFLLKPIDSLLAGHGMSTLAINCIESAVPALAGTVICILPQFWTKNKRIIPGAFAFILLYAILALVAVLTVTDAEERHLFLNIFTLFIPVPVILGFVCSFASLAWFDKNRSVRE
jgi:hypothetical protein